MTEQATMKRVVGLWGAVWMGLGSILGTGVFVSLAIVSGVAGAAVMLAVVLAALVALANGLSSAQLAAAHPVSGGTYEYGYRYLDGRAGFAAGWMFLAAKSASAATAALGCAGYILHTLGFEVSPSIRVGLALGIVAVMTVLVVGGLKRSNVANMVMVSTTLAALTAFVAAGWWENGVGADVSRLSVEAVQSALLRPWALLEATALMFVAYTGYGRIATLGEEVREPSTTIPRAIVATLVVSMALYVAVASSAVVSVGAQDFGVSAQTVAAPLEVVARGFKTPGVASLVAFGAVTAMAGVLLNLLLGLSRVLLAMARRGDMPGMFGHVSERTGGPDRAVWAVGAFIALLVLLGDVRATWSFSAFTVLLYYGITNLAALRLPVEDRKFPRGVAAFGLATCLGLAFFVDPPIWLAGLGLLALGFVARTLVRAAGQTGGGPGA
jgi:APA family basic amino acid/polyamine antiporter